MVSNLVETLFFLSGLGAADSVLVLLGGWDGNWLNNVTIGKIYLKKESLKKAFSKISREYFENPGSIWFHGNSQETMTNFRDFSGPDFEKIF